MRQTTFLIADDSPQKMHMLLDTLKRFGWQGEIVTAETTEDAMSFIDQHSVAYAFIDYYIPSALGPAIISYLKKKNPEARIALVTSSPDLSLAGVAQRAGAEAVVCTSYQADVVEKQLVELLDVWKATISD